MPCSVRTGACRAAPPPGRAAATVRKFVPWPAGGKRLAARALLMDLDGARAQIDIGDRERDRLGDACAGSDQERGERPVVHRAGVEVAVDLTEPQVEAFGEVDRVPVADGVRDEVRQCAWIA